MRSRGTCPTSRSTSVVLPAPEGAETMNSRPREPGLLGILNLLAHFLELGLGRDDDLGDLQPVRLRPHRVDLAVHFLQQEIELAAARLGALGERIPVRDVAA